MTMAQHDSDNPPSLVPQAFRTRNTGEHSALAAQIAALTQQVAAQQGQIEKLTESVTSINTVKKISGAILGALLLAILGSIFAAGQFVARMDHIERSQQEHNALPMHPGSSTALSELRVEQRVQAEQLRQINATTQETRDQVRAIEQRLPRQPR